MPTVLSLFCDDVELNVKPGDFSGSRDFGASDFSLLEGFS